MGIIIQAKLAVWRSCYREHLSESRKSRPCELLCKNVLHDILKKIIFHTIGWEK